jgi:uncharacterized protein YjbJ (UPF0337 family)
MRSPQRRTGSAWKEIGSNPKARSKKSGVTDDDLTQIDGKREQLEGKIEERYGMARDKARTDIDDWLKTMH